MALLCDGKWDIFLCNCDECEQDDQDHVYCGCSFSRGAIVSRATAFRQRARDCQMVRRVMNWMSSNWNPALVKPIQV